MSDSSILDPSQPLRLEQGEKSAVIDQPETRHFNHHRHHHRPGQIRRRLWMTTTANTAFESVDDNLEKQVNDNGNDVGSLRSSTHRRRSRCNELLVQYGFFRPWTIGRFKDPKWRWIAWLFIFLCMRHGISYSWRCWKWRQRYTLHPFVNRNTIPQWQNGSCCSHDDTSIAIFYNLYVGESPLFSVQIFQEQLDQIAHSYVSTANSLILFITTIGNTATKMIPVESICNNYNKNVNDNDNDSINNNHPLNWTCIHVAHYTNATETVTLSRLHDYCASHSSDNDDHDRHLVIYLHNKGSLHPYPWQDRWRRTMTAAVTSQHCVEPLLLLKQKDSNVGGCHACGMLFQPLPSLHYPGNMWIADCSYVNRLLSPDEYHIQRQPIDQWMENEANRSTVFFPMEAHYTGRHRYESEHWLGSHPTLIPCDVSRRSANLNYWLKTDRNYDQEFVGGIAPRHGWQNHDWIWYSYVWHNATLFQDVLSRVQDVFLLRGVIFRFWSLYGSIPPNNSWIWNWFPDGLVWKRAVEEYGIAEVLQQPEMILLLSNG